MPTYAYEILDRSDSPIGEFEVRQSIKDAPLERHPETGQRVRRKVVISEMPLSSRGYGQPGTGDCCPGCVH